MRRLSLLILLLVVSLLAGTSAVAAGESQQDAAPPDEWRYPVGAIEVGVAVGGGASLGHGRQDATLGAILPRVGVVLAQQEVFLPGSLEFVGEPGLYIVGAGGTAAVASLALLLKYNFWTGTRWIPFALAGGGISYASDAIPHGASHFNFLGEAGAGLQYALSARRVLSLEWRFHHISNGNTAATNPSVNSVLLLLGYAVSF
jgi:opacity protein-like surface antigen